MATTVKLYYDVISPYSWIAFEVLCRYRARWNISLDLQPFYLAGIMGGSGNRPPGTNPFKAKYNGKDLVRLKKYYQIPLWIPSNVTEVMFEKGSLLPQRFLIAAKQEHPAKLEELSRQLWLRVWSRDEDIVSPDSIREAGSCARVSDDIVERLLTQAGEQAIKDKLKDATQEALDLGAFGAPFIVAEIGGKKEPFFGTDRFELLASMIGEKWEGPLVTEKAKY